MPRPKGWSRIPPATQPTRRRPHDVTALMVPGPVVVARVSHVTILVMILGPISLRVPARPPMIAVTLIVVAVPIAEGDVAEVDADDCARGRGSGKNRRQDDKGRGQHRPFEQFHANLPF